MRVLVAPAHVVVNPLYGSEPAWAYNLISRLTKNFNIQMYVVCGSSINTAYLNSNNIKTFNVGFTKGNLINRGLFYFKCYNIAKKIYKNTDLVHHMFPFGFRAGFNLLAVFGHLRNKQFIIGPIQYYQEYGDITDYIWVTGKKNINAKISFIFDNIIYKLSKSSLNIFHEITLKEAETLVFDSKKTAKLYKRLYSDLLKYKNLEIIPPGIEIENFRYVPPIKKEYFEILTMGPLLKRKGIQYLIKAMPLILREYKNVRLKIVGDGPYRWELIRLVKKLSLNDIVSFEGRIPRDRIINYYGNCDVYVHPSLSDTFPSTIREAMSVGRPVIATNIGFVDEHIANGVTGFIVPKADTEAIANKVLVLLSDEELRLKIGLKARNYARKEFSWDKIARQWYRVYNEAIL